MPLLRSERAELAPCPSQISRARGPSEGAIRKTRGNQAISQSQQRTRTAPRSSTHDEASNWTKEAGHRRKEH
eukprot:11706675-Alexandrium_andersonii.AAC.1